MDLPIKFPENAEVIAEEAARFRALSPENRVETLGEMFRVYQFLAERSSQPEEQARIIREEAERGRTAVKEFVTRHARSGSH